MPVLGYLDDLVLIPLGITLAVRMIPPEILAEHRLAAAGNRPDQTSSKLGMAIVVAVWCVAAFAVFVWARRLWS